MMLDQNLKERLMLAYHPSRITTRWNILIGDCIVDLEEKDATR